MAASLLHAVSSPLPNPNAPSSLPLVTSPFLRLAPTFRCRLYRPVRLAGGDLLRPRRLVSAFADSNEEPRDPELDEDNAKSKEEIRSEEAQKAWRETLEQFKAEALRMQAWTMDAYDAYSKKMIEVLMDTSQKLRIQADKAQKDLSEITGEIRVEGQEYLKIAADNSPEAVKDITETFRYLGKLHRLSDYEDYHVGIPFGTFLMVGGFLNFMLTGSISAIRFGFILGLALLALGISSLRSQRFGRRSLLILKGQAAIASIIFFRELSVFFQKGWFPNIFVVLVSGMVAVFYIYRIVTGGHKGPTMERRR